ncbi:hypothetical protein [Pectobacterium brasiliense]|uniref:hypothetical protein n=1 Tax=Pectobacterium brasiliense TaxID=180957 RepID=UPI001968FEBE|nr:hypothetical protein [Pectobacterium brasiliense]MBN3121903.1 hypothetical protein [Pectobacterium brasiliense]
MRATDVNVYYDNVVSEKIADKLKAIIMGFYFFEGLFEKEKQIYRDKMEAQRRALIEEDLRINREMEASAAHKREQEIREQERMMEDEDVVIIHQGRYIAIDQVIMVEGFFRGLSQVVF